MFISIEFNRPNQTMNMQIMEIARLLKKRVVKKSKLSTYKYGTEMLESSCNECYDAEQVL